MLNVAFHESTASRSDTRSSEKLKNCYSNLDLLIRVPTSIETCLYLYAFETQALWNRQKSQDRKKQSKFGQM